MLSPHSWLSNNGLTRSHIKQIPILFEMDMASTSVSGEAFSSSIPVVSDTSIDGQFLQAHISEKTVNHLPLKLLHLVRLFVQSVQLAAQLLGNWSSIKTDLSILTSVPECLLLSFWASICWPLAGWSFVGDLSSIWECYAQTWPGAGRDMFMFVVFNPMSPGWKACIKKSLPYSWLHGRVVGKYHSP